MSASGYQQLPQYLITFSLLTKGMNSAPDVATILGSIEKAIRSATPRKSLNRALTRIHRHRPTGISQMIDWIASEKVVTALRVKGAWWAIPLCIEALEKMSQGMTPHVALGMHLPGRRRNMRFSNTQDAGLLANYLIQAGTQREKAIECAQDFREQCLPLQSEIIPQLRPLKAKLSQEIDGLDQSLVHQLELKYGKKIQKGL